MFSATLGQSSGCYEQKKVTAQFMPSKTQSEMVELEVLSRSEHKHNLSLSLFSVGHSGQQCRSCWSEPFKTFHLIGCTCIASGSGFFVYVLRSLFSNLVLLAYCPVWFVL